mmetsp:Transcript_15028/g.23092  ORF Transcript_15028/g.23092 Transcript_15028/m.23092 type:complete len:369 (-) Transcript_15028:68-1174(-)
MSTSLFDRRRESLNNLKRQYGIISDSVDGDSLREAKRMCFQGVGNYPVPRPAFASKSPLSNINEFGTSTLTHLSNTDVSRSLLLNASMGNEDAILTRLLANNSTSKLNYPLSMPSILDYLDGKQKQNQMIEASHLGMLARSLNLAKNQARQEILSHGLLDEKMQLEHAREALLKQQRCMNENLNSNFLDSRAIADDILSAAMKQNLPSLACAASQSEQLSPISLYMPCDDNYLSEYQILLRKQIEFFQTGETELEAVAHSRQTKVKVGKVGIRCKHCAKLAPSLRPKGAVYYPGHLRALYQAAQNMAKTHFSGRGRMIDQHLQSHMQKLSTHKAVAGHVGRKYWSGGAKSIGIVEHENGGLSFSKKDA